MGYKIILTADQGSFTDYSGDSVLGYVACMPYRLIPRLFMEKFFTPKIKYYDDYRAYIAPYPLRKIESSLLHHGYTEDDVAVIPPHVIKKVVDNHTRVLGISAHDPFGLNPVSYKLSMLFGGGQTWTAKFFEELGEAVSSLKKKYNFKVIVGGPGAWEMQRYKPDWVDTVFLGHAELDFPILVDKIIKGDNSPSFVIGKDPKADQIPPIIHPARLGEVQITRGCPRGCWFCSITPETFLSIPIETIKKEVAINLSTGFKNIEFITDDVMLYGSNKLKVNHDALVRLFTEIRKMGVNKISWPHISSPPVKESPKTVKAISEIANYSEDNGNAPVVGLETGSEKIFNKYMHAKAFPWTAKDWKNVTIDATTMMNESYIYPCYTMTIGYPEETDEDVKQSIDLVQSIIDHDLIAWIFPLPVIPMGTTRIKKNPFPVIKGLPSLYWDLLYISWKYSLKTTRRLIPTLTKGLKNAMISKVVRLMIDKIFDNIEWVFYELKKTKGIYSFNFSNINLNNTLGVIKSIYWLFKISAIKRLN